MTATPRSSDGQQETSPPDPEFRAFYDANYARALGTARRICRSRELAEDVTQQVFLELWRALAQDGRQPRSDQLSLAVKHRSYDALRHRRSNEDRWYPIADTQFAHATRCPAGRAQDLQVLRSVGASMERLTDQQRRVVVLSLYGELSQREISVSLDIPLGTVKGRMRLGLAKLRHDLRDTGFAA